MKSSKIVESDDNRVIVQVEIPYKSSMFEGEEILQQKINEVGTVATGELVKQFDTDDGEIIMGDIKWTSKGKIKKIYQTPYGAVEIKRNVYQTSKGGVTYCPLERDARIIRTSTPKFSKMVTSKYAEFGGLRVSEDLRQNHGRTISCSFIQKLTDKVNSFIFIKEPKWVYELPKMAKPVHTISVGLDGTCMMIANDAYRQAMVGTIAFFDENGERQHTIYIASAPESGKKNFLEKLDRELTHVKAKFPKAKYVGLADGAKDNWGFLESRTSIQILDFWHAIGYLGTAAEVMYKTKDEAKEKKLWLDNTCTALKKKHRRAAQIINEIKDFSESRQLSKEEQKNINTVITYFTNNRKRMHYARYLKQNLPIGSGVTEAACKLIVKQRLCGPGMKWKNTGAQSVLNLRAIHNTEGRWNQFWRKVDRYGFWALPEAA